MRPVSAPPRWESLGPDTISGAIRQLVVDPNERRRLYAASANGGVWCLADVDAYPTTSVWRPLIEQIGHLRFRTVAVAPGRPEVLYAANVVKRLHARPSATLDVRSEVWWSTDRGSTWLPIHKDGLSVVHRLVVDPVHAVPIGGRDLDRAVAARRQEHTTHLKDRRIAAQERSGAGGRGTRRLDA